MVVMLGAAALVLGCGSTDDYANDPRPPAPIDVAVNITNDRVMVSPDRIGAGPIVLLVANESDRARDVMVSSPENGGRACVDADATSGPINPRGNARVQLEVVEGECVVGVRGRGGPRAARLRVGPQRPSAQNELLQP
jgi:hypothetical protein